MISSPTLTTLLKRLGPAEVFIGNPMVADTMASLGRLQGDRNFEVEWEENNLTMEEWTGGLPHEQQLQVSAARITCSIVLNAEGAAIWPKISPTGTNGAGSLRFVVPAETAVLLIPITELGGSLNWNATGTPQWERTLGNGVPAATGATAAPVHAVWLWRATVRHGSIPYPWANGGKSMVDVTFTGMIDVTKPDGHMIYTIGNPRTVSPTPILADI